MIIVDMDHTLADSRWRDNKLPGELDWQGWDHYHARCGEDKPNPYVCSMVRLLGMAVDIVIITGRPAKNLQVTEQWLRFHNIPFKTIIMRADDDHTPAEQLKISAAEYLCDELKLDFDSDIHLVIDDNIKIIEAFRKRGITGLQVHIGENYES
jgi:hypothetical protein